MNTNLLNMSGGWEREMSKLDALLTAAGLRRVKVGTGGCLVP